MTDEAEVLDASQAADLAALQAMAGADMPQEVGDAPPAVTAVDKVEAMFSPAFKMLAATGPKNAAFYTPQQARMASETFVALADAEGWDLSGLESKWGLRIAFLMCVTPPHAVEWVIGRVMAFALPVKPDQVKKEEGANSENR